MPRVPMLTEATTWITEMALRHPHTLREQVALRLGVGPVAAGRLLRRLHAAQWLQCGGTARRPLHAPGLMRQVVRRYALAGLQDDLPWAQHFLPCLQLPDNLAQLAQHAFTELLNNAIEHSGGSTVTVSVRQTPWQLQMLVSDDGRGIFDVIGSAFDISDPAEAMLQLALGRLSTRPDSHSGRGLFFTARLADIIDLHANGHAFQQCDWQREQWHRTRAACRHGSAVYVAFHMDTDRRLDDVLRRYSLDGQGHGFDRTVLPLQLATGAQLGLVSRAQARRLVQRLQGFRRVDLDFEGLADVGHGFADELLRVLRPQLAGVAGVDLVPVNMSPQVAALVASVQTGEPA